MASENCVICLIGAMDKLWFHQMILFPQPYSFVFPDIKSPDFSSKNTSQTSVLSFEETSSPVILNSTGQLENTSTQRSDGDEEITKQTRLAHRESRNTRYPDLSTKRSQKTISCKSLGELELEEVKGLMDLGFTFKKENMSRQIMNLIPGLQRIEACKEGYKNLHLLINDFDYDTDQEEEEDKEEEDEEGIKGVMRPYLSEAWLIKRPDSPLLNLRIPKVSTAASMKKHLKYWARTVASAIREESC